MGIAQFTAGQEITALELNQLPVVVSYLTPGSTSNTSAESVIGTFTIPAGDPSFPGGYWWKVFGTLAAVSSPTMIVRMRLNSVAGSQMLSPGAGTVSVSPVTFAIVGSLMFTGIGSSGSYQSENILNAQFGAASSLSPGLPSAAISINTTISNTIVVTAQWGTPSASNVAATVAGALYRL